MCSCSKWITHTHTHTHIRWAPFIYVYATQFLHGSAIAPTNVIASETTCTNNDPSEQRRKLPLTFFDDGPDSLNGKKRTIQSHNIRYVDLDM